MKIYNASQLKALDEATIANEPIASIDLMERAGNAIFEQIKSRCAKEDAFVVCCGAGNNGGDGLVVARLLHLAGMQVKVLVLKGKFTEEFLVNFSKIKALPIQCHEIENEDQIQSLTFDASEIIIDAIFGVGLSRPAQNMAALLIAKLNSFNNRKWAIDLPSGLSPDALFPSSPLNTVQAAITFTIQLPKMAFYMADNKIFTGEIVLVDIGLSENFMATLETNISSIDVQTIKSLLKPRAFMAHKNTFGHALIIAGSEGKIGASLLSSKAALRTGCGLVTSYIPTAAEIPLLSFLPEAMYILHHEEDDLENFNLDAYHAIGIGPGIGTDNKSLMLLTYVLKNFKGPIVLDADAITLLSKHQLLWSLLDSRVVLTPHPGEFDRLTQKHNNGIDRFHTQQSLAKKTGTTILLKGPYTSIVDANSDISFNTTGNNGMATAGSGDVLTGIITSLLAQGYEPATAARLGAFLHGAAGDTAALKLSKTSLIASDIINCIPDFFLRFEKPE